MLIINMSKLFKLLLLYVPNINKMTFSMTTWLRHGYTAICQCHGKFFNIFGKSVSWDNLCHNYESMFKRVESYAQNTADSFFCTLCIYR